MWNANNREKNFDEEKNSDGLGFETYRWSVANLQALMHLPESFPKLFGNSHLSCSLLEVQFLFLDKGHHVQ
jgi:hypothetical protein